MSSQRPESPRFASFFGVLLAASCLLFLRLPGSGFVFDEQEAILANPYVQGRGSVSSVLRLDFWGLPARASIGSYRPLPNLVWRLWAEWTSAGSAFLLQLMNPVLHAAIGGALSLFIRRVTRSPWAAYAAGLWFVVAAISTEVVSSIVGLADLLVGLSLGVGLLGLALPPGPRHLSVCLLVLGGMLSKETMLAGVVLLPLAALVPGATGSCPGGGGTGGESVPAAPGAPARPDAAGAGARPLWGALSIFGASLSGALVFFVLKRALFLADIPRDGAPPGAAGWFSSILAWTGQAALPIDPFNNPLLGADLVERVCSALRIFAASWLQMLVPWQLCADYSFPRERVMGPGSGALLGLLLLTAPVLLVLWRRWRRRAWDLLDLGLVWTPVSVLPVSNLLILLPTIRAERLYYVPLMGIALLLANFLCWVTKSQRAAPSGGGWPFGPWPGRALVLLGATSAVQARAHSLHYQRDVSFWRAATLGAPASAKAHLNLGVMLGARGDIEGRIAQSRRALELAPEWPLAHVYLGDALCRGSEPSLALPHYLQGLALAPDRRDLVALALQCLWQTGQFARSYDPLLRVASGAKDSWLMFLLREVHAHGLESGGVPSEYRPRGYNQGLSAALSSAQQP